MDPFDPASWERIEPILDALLEAPESGRSAILDEACGSDAGLRAAVLRLLDATGDRGATDPLGRPAAAVAADLLGVAGPESPPAPPAPPARRPGDLVAGYEIRALIGRGGMGEVYRAHHPTLDRDVALKLLPAHATGSDEARERLIREARTASRLDHPNVQTVFDAGQTGDGDVYLALAYYDGETLAERLARDGALPVDEVERIAAQLADGLAAAHAAGVVHRDVKPGNLLVLPDGRLKILDFGIARLPEHDLTREGRTYGTIGYMSPEQTRGLTADPRSDVWAAGVVLYELLTGRRPFRGADDRTLIHAIRHDEPPAVRDLRPEAPATLAAAIERCLRKEAGERFADAAALRAAVRGHADARSGFRWRSGAALLVGAAVLVAIVAGAFRLFPREPAVVHPAAGAMTIIPFAPVTGDSALGRLGRQLAVTLSTNLDGVGPIRTTEGLTVLMGVDAAGPDEASDGLTLARRFAATSYLRGTLLEAEGRVRVDAALHDAETDSAVARFAAAGPRDDIAVLTDSITFAVLNAVWQAGEIPAPSLAAATTRSVPALRAYLDGELALAAGRFDEAIRSFEASFRADSTFWFALWRSVYPRTYESWATLEPEVYERLYENRRSLPEPARLEMESDLVRGLSARLDAKHDLTRRYPSYLPGWWSYANQLVHYGPLVGREPSEARAALERTLELNPNFLPAWEHLLWNAAVQRDVARVGDALARLEEAGRAGNERLNAGPLAVYLLLDDALRAPGASGPELERRIADVAAVEGPLAPFVALGLPLVGMPMATQEAVNDAVLSARPPPALADLHRFGGALARAGHGSWEEGLDRAAALPLPALDSRAPMAVYGLAVTGAWLGEVEPERARDARPAGPPPSAAVTAERAWLDGLLAFATGDRAELEAAIGTADATASPHAHRLARSLEAFRLAFDGDSASAGRRLAELEQEGAETFAFDGYGAPHPWLTPVNRLAAARWLVAAGDTARAERLLGWEEASLQERHFLMGPAGVLVGTRALPLRARLAAARGDTAREADLRRRMAGFPP
jgi:tetratricopeptide (TPR) repeat protein